MTDRIPEKIIDRPKFDITHYRPNFDKKYIPPVIVRSQVIRAQFEDPIPSLISSDIIITTCFKSDRFSASRPTGFYTENGNILQYVS